MRSYRELWLWLGGLFLVLVPFPAAIAIAYYAKKQDYSVLLNIWMLAACVFLLFAFACFFAAIKGRPFPPWTRVGFPDISVQIFGGGFSTTNRTVHVHGAAMPLVTPESLQIFKFRVINRETEQNASLTIRYYAKLVPGSLGDVAESVCDVPDWALEPTAKVDPLSMPILLQPGTAVAGDLAYRKAPYHQFAQEAGRLEIEDHISGQRMSIPAIMSRYDKKTMTPSVGGVQFLLPEDMPQTDEAGTGGLVEPDADPATTTPQGQEEDMGGRS